MRFRLCLGFLAMGLMVSCSSVAGGAPEDLDETSSSGHERQSSAVVKSSSSRSESPVQESSGSAEPSCSSALSSDSLLSYYVSWVKIPASSVKRGSMSFSVSSFEIGKTEVTQSLYRTIMDSLPAMGVSGDSIPVANVNWYEAILFCNALSKKVGLDTAYVYEAAETAQYLQNLYVDYSVESVRLPTEMEWEVAYRAGTTTTYYWDREEASKYAYYVQSSGPTVVAQFMPNAYGLYDMAGNVAEWTNDWYGVKPTKSQMNYTGAKSGSLKVVRGGGWGDKVKALAADTVAKREPLYRGKDLGLRLVHSTGF